MAGSLTGSASGPLDVPPTGWKIFFPFSFPPCISFNCLSRLFQPPENFKTKNSPQNRSSREYLENSASQEYNEDQNSLRNMKMNERDENNSDEMNEGDEKTPGEMDKMNKEI